MKHAPRVDHRSRRTQRSSRSLFGLRNDDNLEQLKRSCSEVVSEMSQPYISDAKYWHERAAEARSIAKLLGDRKAKRQLLAIAGKYDQLADHFKDRSKARTNQLIMLRGRAEMLREGQEHQDAQHPLRSRYPQLAAMQIATYPVIAVRIERTRSWGDLSVGATNE